MLREKVLLTTALAPVVWGTTYLTTTELLPPDRPLLAATLRALPAGLVLMAAYRIRPRGSWWWRVAVLGTLNIGGFFALLFVAAYRLPGGVAAVVGALTPVLVALLAPRLTTERTSAAALAAGLLGVVGVSLLVLRSQVTLDVVGLLAALGSAVSMSLGVLLTKRWGRPVPLLAFTAWQLLAGGLVLLPLAVVVEGAPPSLDLPAAVGYSYLALVGTALAYAAWFRGIVALPVARVAVLGLLSPVVATTAGWLVLGQSLAPLQVVGAAVVVAAVVLAQLHGPSARPPRDGSHRGRVSLRPSWEATNPRRS
ncbi:EamA family transporter [Pseudokineococcus sp. 1T1Z-3]|uniref:EamA family transporter n=1 Tax=Pseudokineococcus sp. 1T1Z-3 TaxID=3132745 RepID=UPI0030B398DE